MLAMAKFNSKRKTRSHKLPLTFPPTGRYCEKITQRWERKGNRCDAEEESRAREWIGLPGSSNFIKGLAPSTWLPYLVVDQANFCGRGLWGCQGMGGGGLCQFGTTHGDGVWTGWI